MNSDNNLLTKIYKIPIFPLDMINSFLLVKWKKCILVDTWLPGTESKIKKELDKIWLSFENIKLIVITHAHIDHAGNTSLLKSFSWAKVIGHKNDLLYFQGKKKMTFCSTWWFWTIFSKTWAIQKSYEDFTPDILLWWNEEFDLSSYWFNWKVISTPGHTSWSISVLLDNKIAIVWDLISSGILLWWILFKSKAKRPPFEENPYKVWKSLKTIIDNWYTDFFMWHWWPLYKKEVLLHSQKLISISKK